MSNDVTAILVAIQINGETCLAPIKDECRQMFLLMLPAFQESSDINAGVTLYRPPPDIMNQLHSVCVAIDGLVVKKDVSNG